MKDHHTKIKGDLGVLKVATDLCQQGFVCFFSHSEHIPFDLIAYKNNRCYRIQIKYRKISLGAIHIDLRTCWSDKHGNHVKRYDLDEIDYFAIYCPDVDLCYYFPVKRIHHINTISLRIEPAKNHQKDKIQMAKDFRKI